MSEKVGDVFKCAKCGKKSIKATWNQRYCSSCSGRDRIANRCILGTPIKCCDCGKTIVKKAPNQLRCKECAKRIEKKRDHEREKNAVRKYRLDGVKPPKVSIKTKSVVEMAFEARALGLTYGEYATLYDSGRVNEWCAVRGINAENVLENARKKLEAERRVRQCLSALIVERFLMSQCIGRNVTGLTALKAPVNDLADALCA